MVTANADITLFSKVCNPTTRLDEWQHSWFLGVSFRNKVLTNVGDKGLISANSFIVCVCDISSPSGTAYASPEEYTSMSDDEKKNHWTIKPDDVIAHGLLSVSSPKEVTAEHFTVVGVTDNRRGSPKMQYIRIEGK